MTVVKSFKRYFFSFLKWRVGMHFKNEKVFCQQYAAKWVPLILNLYLKFCMPPQSNFEYLLNSEEAIIQHKKKLLVLPL